ncbi:MAG: branched-chain amino acid ABC transporter permease [Candidatus Heimdallarchaeota archaeon]
MLTIIGQTLISGILMGGIYALVSIGLTLIFGVMNVVNFAHGEFLMLAMYLTYWLFHYFHLDPYLAIFLVTPVLFIVGVLTQKLIMQHLVDKEHYTQIFATVGLSIAMANAALFFWKADYRMVKTSYTTSVIDVGQLVVSYPRLISFLVAIAITFLLFVFLKYTYLGKAIRATSQDNQGAKLMGVNIRRVYVITLGIGSACVGVAGALLMPIYYAFPNVGLQFVLIAFVCVVLGGMGNITGAFFGGLIIGLVESFSGFFIAPDLKEAVYFIIFILVLLIKPSGLFGLISK